ncbi:hypothetical protein M9458_041734 [Cirrhinus mrigala]|uniref:Uncharacterized protein n=1 Tax=Cirrhinus mrigala TaxID=683832 RepID=A0ABD0NK20_CIRMR
MSMKLSRIWSVTCGPLTTRCRSHPVTNQRRYKSPGLSPCKPRNIVDVISVVVFTIVSFPTFLSLVILPGHSVSSVSPPALFGLLLVIRITLLSLVLDYVRRRSTHACLTDYLCIASNIPVCCCSDPACLTMSLLRPVNKSLRMDPLASRLTHSVTEYSVATGSSSFTPGHSADMDTDRILFRIKQGPRTLEQYTREAKLRHEGPRSSLATFMDFALLCVGSPFTVGGAEEECGNAEMADTHPKMAAAAERVHSMAATTESAYKMAATAVPVRKMAAAPVRVHKMAATAEPVHKMAAKTGLCHVTAAIPEPSQAAAAFPESSQVSKSSQVAAAFPESSQVSKSSQVAAVFPESSQVSESGQATATVPVSSQAMAVVPASSQVRAVFPASSQVKAALPKASQVKAVFPVSSQVTAVVPKSSKVTAVVPEPSKVTAVVPESSQVRAVVPESSKVIVDLHKPSQVTAGLHVSDQVTADLHESSQVTAESGQATTDLHKPGQVTADLHEPSQVTADLHVPGQATVGLHEPSQALTGLHEPSKATADLHEPSQVIAAGPESSHVPPVRPEPSHVSSDRPEPSHVSSVCPGPSHISTVCPEFCLDTSDRQESSQVSSDLPEPCYVMSASVMAITILSIWAASYAPEVPSVTKSAPEVSSVTKSVPEFSSDPPEPHHVMSASVMAITILSMWAAHYAPKVSPVHKSAPEVSSDHESAPEASPVGEAAPMPPEVSASAVEPLMEATFSYGLFASLLVLSASSIPALPRSQSMTRVPALPWRAPALPALPWRAPAPPAAPPSTLPAPPWRALAPPVPPWRAPASPSVLPAPPWRALAPPAPPWRALAPPAPPWWAPALPVLPQSPVPPHGPGPPTLALSRSRPTAPLDCCSVGASGSCSLGGGGGGGGYVMNLVGDLWSAHHQMSLSPCQNTQTVAPHPGLHSPSFSALIGSAPVTNPGLSPCKPRSIVVVISVVVFTIVSFPTFLSLIILPGHSVSSVWLPALFGLLLVIRITLLSLVLDYVHRRSTQHTASNIPVCCSSDPACLTMSLPRPVNKSLRMDPLASRLTHSVNLLVANGHQLLSDSWTMRWTVERGMSNTLATTLYDVSHSSQKRNTRVSIVAPHLCCPTLTGPPCSAENPY